MTPEDVWSFLTQHFAAGTALAAALAALTATGLSLLNQDRKDAIALWLMGTEGSEETWTRSFTAIFDAIFGSRHFSLRCIASSVLASLVAVVALWLLLGMNDGFQARLDAAHGLGTVLLIGLLVNAVADYVSLLETRWLLGRIERWHHPTQQAVILVIDLLLTAAIIWVALWGFQQTPWYSQITGGDGEDLGEVLLIFSPFAVFFYSTFVTSIWTWFYVISTWLMRFLSRLRLARWFDVAGKPVKVFFFAVAPVIIATGFVASAAIGALTTKDASGLTLLDRTVCSATRDRACLAVAKLSSSNAGRLRLLKPMTETCREGFVRECINDRLAAFGMSTSDAVTLHVLACEAGDLLFCANLGYLYDLGIGLDQDYSRAAQLFSRSCGSGEARGCTGIGTMAESGTYPRLHRETFQDLAELAAPFYRQGCEGGDALGCSRLGLLLMQGIGVAQDPALAAQLFSRGCDGGDALACINAGSMHLRGIGVAPDRVEAARLYRQGCDSGGAQACDLADQLEANSEN